MWPDRDSNPGPLTYESGALPIALPGPATSGSHCLFHFFFVTSVTERAPLAEIRSYYTISVQI